MVKRKNVVARLAQLVAEYQKTSPPNAGHFQAMYEARRKAVSAAYKEAVGVYPTQGELEQIDGAFKYTNGQTTVAKRFNDSKADNKNGS